MKKKNSNKGFFTRVLMALAIIAAIMSTDCGVALAAEPAVQIEVIGDLEIVIKRGSNYVDPGYAVVAQDGVELLDLKDKVVTKFYEVKQVDGKWTEVLLNPFDTNRIAKIKVRYFYGCDALAYRDLDIVDQYDPEYDTWAKGQIAAQKAYIDAEKAKNVSAATASGNTTGEKKSSSSSSSSNGNGSTSTGGGGGNLGDGGSGGTGGTNIGGGGGSLGDGGSGGSGGTAIGG